MRSGNKGFTLIEMLVVMSLAVLAISFGLFFDFSEFRSYYFRGDRDALISALQHARSQAMVNICGGSGCEDGRPHGVAIRPSDNPDSYIIFQSGADPDHPDYSHRDEDFDVALDANPSTIISGSVSEVVFSQLSGNVEDPGNIILKDEVGKTWIISISSEGQITWENE